MLFTAKMKRVRGEERKGGGPWWVCARNTVNDSSNPTVTYKECGCDECRVGGIVVETTEDCPQFVPDCDSCDVKDCDETVCRRVGAV